MPFFLCAGRVVETTHSYASSTDKSTFKLLGFTIHLIILAIQSGAIILTFSRGPWLGWFSGIFFFGIFVSAIFRKRSVMLGILSAGAAFTIFLALLNTGDTTPRGPGELPPPSTLSRLFAGMTGSGRVRTLIWEGNAKLVAPHDGIAFPDGAKDPFNAVRPWIGYGPESMQGIFNRFYPPDLSRYESRTSMTDRSHNETWDILISGGVLGLIAWQSLLCAVFASCLKWGGIFTSPFHIRSFAAVWTILSVASALLLITMGVPQFIGLGIPISNILTVISFVILFSLLPTYSHQQKSSIGFYDGILIASSLSGILAHYVEIQFGIAITPTRLLFWAFIAIAGLVSSHRLAENDTSNPASTIASAQTAIGQASVGKATKKSRIFNRKRASDTIASAISPPFRFPRALLPFGTLSVITMATLFFEFTTNYMKQKSFFPVLFETLKSVCPIGVKQGEPSFALLLILLLTSSTFAAVAISGEEMSEYRKRPKELLFILLYFLAGTVLASLVTAVIFSQAHAALGALSATSTDHFAVTARILGICDRYYSTLLFLSFLLVFSLLPQRQPTDFPIKKKLSIWKIVTITGIFLGLALFIYQSILVIVRADVISQQGEFLKKDNLTSAAIDHAKGAILLAPAQDVYYLKFGALLSDLAPERADTPHVSVFGEHTTAEEVLHTESHRIASLGHDDVMHAARAILMRAYTLHPLHPDHISNLARLFSRWAEHASINGNPMASALAERASAYYRQTTTVSPFNSIHWNEWAVLEFFLRGNVEGGLEKIQKSLSVDPYFDQTYQTLGDMYLHLQNPEKAIAAFKKSLYLRPDNADVEEKLGFIFAEQGNVEEAIAAYSHYINLRPSDPNAWGIHRNLALLYAQIDDLNTAVHEAELSLKLAPEAERPRLKSMLSELRGQRSQIAPSHDP